ncbi:MAG TPA: hypothetical protein VG223_17545 [Solirubrobacteraceae bacterium]|jgi:hypothetical protein|nr:hypothetical protein [Solirubrobacteraceae bacterium]
MSTDTHPPRFTVVVPVGPDPAELDRLADLLISLRVCGRDGAHGPPKLVLIDDAPRPRKLERFWSGAAVVRTALWERRAPDPLSAMTAGTIEAMKRAEGEFALKLDTDALVIGPFADALSAAFAADPSLGVLGAYDRSPDGGRRDWSMWPARLRRSTWLVSLAPAAGRGWRLRVRPRRERVAARAVLAAAGANRSYELGAHCLGGAYAVSRRLLAQASQWDWRPWVGAGLGEDVVVGLYCAAAGLRMGGMVDSGEPFGVNWSGLPAPPPELVERGFGIVHSVKSGRYGTEAGLRAWFRAHTQGEL